MSDEVLSIDVNDAAVDASLAKLEQALALKEKLTGQPTQNDPNGIIINEASSKQRQTQLDTFDQPQQKPRQQTPKESDFSAFWSNLDKQADTANQKIDEAISKTPEIKGVESSANRIIRMIPGLREANRLYKDINMISSGNLLGVIGLLTVAISIYQQVAGMLEDQKRQQEQYQQEVMQLRGFTTASEFQNWQASQQQSMENWRTSSPTMVS